MLQDNIPARYVVVKGDTLWGISSRFLKNPWKWPDLWGINKDVVRNPHWIYPGDVLILDLTGATPRLRLEGAPDGGLSRWYGYELQVSNLTPQMRSQGLAPLAIPTIPAKAIDPFLVRPLIVNPAQVAGAPKIVANVDKRVVVSAGDTAYVMGLDQKKGQRWQVYRKGRVFQDPDTKEVLGFEAVYLGDANVTGFGEISTVQVVSAIQEIALGDRLTVAPPLQSMPYVPRAPSRPVDGPHHRRLRRHRVGDGNLFRRHPQPRRSRRPGGRERAGAVSLGGHHHRIRPTRSCNCPSSATG